MKKIINKLRYEYFRLIVLNNRRYFKSITNMNFIDSDELAFDIYISEVRKILTNQKLFDNFKRNWIYNIVLEHLDKTQGELYLDVLRNRSDGILESAKSNVFVTDSIGNPRKFQFSEGLLSPTTIRYVKVVSDLRRLFGTDLKSIAEIGCGYGGQTIVSSTLNNYLNFTLFDLDDVNGLIKRYLNNFILDGSFITTTINEFSEKKYFDLVISNYAFSELPRELQKKYIEKIMIYSKRGYLTMNSGLFEQHIGNKLSLIEINDILPDLEFYLENSSANLNSYIIVWGNSGKLENEFKI